MLYAKTDGQLYTKRGANQETLVHAGSGWSANSEGDLYVTDDTAVGIGTTNPSNSKLHVAAGHLNLDDDYAIAWGGGSSRASITGSKADSTLNINPGAGGVVVIGDAASTNATLSSAQVAKAWVTTTNNSNTITDSYNVSSVTDNSAGHFTVNFTTDQPDANYCVVANATRGHGTWAQDSNVSIFTHTRSVGSFVMKRGAPTETTSDVGEVSRIDAIVFGT
jgi:hypothetical protein